MSTSLNIIFFGTPEFAVPTLKALKDAHYNIAGVVTVPDKPLGRKRILTAPPIKVTAEELGLSVLQPTTLRDDSAFEQFKALQPDLCIVVAYGKIIPQRYLDVPRLGFINIHPSALPKYRGPSPIQSAIRNGDAETAVSIMLIDAEIDHGPILAMEPHAIPGQAYFSEIAHELAVLGADTLTTILLRYIEGTLQPQEQDHSKATFTKMLTREDGRINWQQSAQEIYNQIRALNPEPGTWTIYDSKTLSVLNANPVIGNTEVPLGTVIAYEKTIAVVTSAGFLELELIQQEGGKPISASDFLAGHPNLIGSLLT